MQKAAVFSVFLLLVTACATNSQAIGEKLIAEQEAKEGSNKEHYKIQEAAAREHKDK